MGEYADQTPVVPLDDLRIFDAAPLILRYGRPAMRASECNACGTRFFPSRRLCTSCRSSNSCEIALNPTGCLYSFTTVRVSSTREVPYTLGYVDLDDGVRVLGEVRDRGRSLTVDQPVEFVADDSGAWWFRPRDTDEDARR